MSRDILSKSLNPNKYEHPLKPSFSVHKNGTEQTNITGAEKVTWPTEEFDTNSNFASDRFTPTIAGKYFLSVTILWVSLVSGDSMALRIYKNGTEYKTFNDASPGVSQAQTTSVIVDANGSTDYFEVFAENLIRNTADINGLAHRTFFTGCKID